MFQNWRQTQHWKKRQRTQNNDYAHQKYGEKRRVDGESSQTWRHEFFLCQISGDCQNRHNHQKSTDQHRHSQSRVIPERIGV